MTAPQRHVPRHRIEALAPRRARHALVVPVINEGERIRGQLLRIRDSGVLARVDVIVADGGSTDGSLDAGFLREAGVRVLLTKDDDGRLSSQLRMGYAFALDEGYEGIVTIDGNGKDSVGSIPLFVDALEEGVDYAQASRFVPGGGAVNTPRIRTLAIRLVHAPAISLAAGHRLTDTTQGFRAYSRRYLEDPRVLPFRPVFRDYELLSYLSVRASQIGLRVREVPTVRSYPSDGSVPTKISGLRGYWRLMRTLGLTLAHRYHPEGRGR